MFQSFVSLHYKHTPKKTCTTINKSFCGRMLFGTGDVIGYAANVEYAKRIKPGKVFSKHFAIGAELSFENGAAEPNVYTTPDQESLSRTYHSTTNIVFTPKLTYYSFNKTFAKGINITGGISAGYTSQAWSSNQVILMILFFKGASGIPILNFTTTCCLVTVLRQVTS